MMHRSLAAAAAALLLFACSDDPAPPSDADVAEDVAADADTGTTDAGDDADTGTPDTDDDADGGEDVGADADAADTNVGGPCETQDDCGEDGLCIDNVCESLACLGPNDWVKCSDLFNRVEEDAGRYATCTDGRCRQSCLLDSECEGENPICTDFGICREFDGDLTVAHPHGPATGTLQAGVANQLMNFPVGVPLGGYGDRAAINDGRYAVSLKASAGQMHGLYSRAVVLDNGERHLMIVRLPTIFTQMALHEDLAQALQERTGKSWRDNIVISSTHTHSGPCRHWHLPGQAAAPLGAFGIGEFSQFFYDLLRDTVIDTAMAALDDLSPAEFGWEIVEAYDVDDQVGRDRWSQTPKFDDNRVLLMRVDSPEGVPRAALFSYGAHGTTNGSELLTGDGVGMTERAFEDALGREFDTYVPAFFINQNSGTMGPAGGSVGHSFPMDMERMGWAFADKTIEAFLEIETTDQLTLNTNNLRFPMSYDLLGYERGQFSSPVPPPFGGEYHYGGLSCVGDNGGDDDFETHQEIEDMSCAGALQFLLYNRPPTTLSRSQIMTIEINGLTIATVPGELSMELSWQMLRMLRDDFGLDPLETWTFGYANDHLFYLLPTNLRGELPPFPGMEGQTAPDEYPDFAFSFLQGGYESTMSMWGPNQGDFLVERVADAYNQMIDDAYEPTLPEVLPSRYQHRDEPEFDAQPTASDVIGTFSIQVPATVERFTPVEFAWWGGDPAAEMPQLPLVTLERQVDEEWEAVKLDNTLDYNNLSPKMITRVRRAGDLDDFEWVVRWEELHDFPTGTYRFRIDGHYFNDAMERTAYNVATDAFDFVASDDLVVTFDGVDGTIAGTIGYPADERGRFSGPSSDPARASGNFRMRHPMVATGLSAPIAELEVSDLDVDFDGSVIEGGEPGFGLTEETRAVGGRNIPVSVFTADSPVTQSGTWDVTVTFEDRWGNTGSATTTLTVENDG